MHLADMHYPLHPLNRPPQVIDARGGVLGHGRRKVAIVGAGHGAREAPLDDPEWIVWALNCVPPLSEGRLRCDLWWEMHQREAQTADDLRWIAACPVPIMVPDDLMDASPRAVRYPIERAEAEYGNYWACTFAYQLAYAGLCDVTDVGLYGVELAWGTPRERTVEWACVSWWMGRLEGEGIRFHQPEKSCLGRHPARYGLEYRREIDDVAGYIEKFERDILRRHTHAGMGG